MSDYEELKVDMHQLREAVRKSFVSKPPAKPDSEQPNHRGRRKAPSSDSKSKETPIAEEGRAMTSDISNTKVDISCSYRAEVNIVLYEG